MTGKTGAGGGAPVARGAATPPGAASPAAVILPDGMVSASENPAVENPAAEALLGPVPTVRQLFWGFFVVGITGFGGVLPFARRMLIEERRWMTPKQFTDLFSLCQFLPGPNIINLSMIIGLRFRGAWGMAACVFGILGAPFLLILGVGMLYTTYGYMPEIQAVLRGLAAAAAGLVLAMAFKMIGSARPRNWRMIFGVLAFAGIGLLRLPLAMVLGLLAPVSIALAWFRK